MVASSKINVRSYHLAVDLRQLLRGQVIRIFGRVLPRNLLDVGSHC